MPVNCNVAAATQNFRIYFRIIVVLYEMGFDDGFQSFVYGFSFQGLAEAQKTNFITVFLVAKWLNHDCYAKQFPQYQITVLVYCWFLCLQTTQ